MCLLIKVFDGLLQLGKTVLLFLVDQNFVNHILTFSLINVDYSILKAVQLG